MPFIIFDNYARAIKMSLLQRELYGESDRTGNGSFCHTSIIRLGNKRHIFEFTGNKPLFQQTQLIQLSSPLMLWNGQTGEEPRVVTECPMQIYFV